MKNLKVNKLNKKLAWMALSTILATTNLTGCSPELAAEEEYDIVEHNSEDGLETGLTQELEVPGENFKLVAEYSCDATSKREWRITSDKFLYLTVYTKGLSENTEVYIDNIHIDTSIKSKYAAFDGIIQDTMDDRIHNSQMLGFPISDSIYYYGVNAIEGCNETFISGTVHGYSGWANGTITEKRFTESDYVEYGVWANKIQIVYDLLVKGPNDMVPRNISVATDFVVPVTSKDTYDDEDIEENTNNKQLTKTLE